MTTMTDQATCRYCGRDIVNEAGRWIDPEATGDDSVWRETCQDHDTFTAEHEPTQTIWDMLEKDAPEGHGTPVLDCSCGYSTPSLETWAEVGEHYDQHLADEGLRDDR